MSQDVDFDAIMTIFSRAEYFDDKAELNALSGLSLLSLSLFLSFMHRTEWVSLSTLVSVSLGLLVAGGFAGTVAAAMKSMAFSYRESYAEALFERIRNYGKSALPNDVLPAVAIDASVIEEALSEKRSVDVGLFSRRIRIGP